MKIKERAINVLIYVATIAITLLLGIKAVDSFMENSLIRGLFFSFGFIIYAIADVIGIVDTVKAK